MTIAKDFASKAAVAFVAVAMVFTMFAPAASAQQSSTDLQAMIDSLLAQIASLQGELGQTSSAGAGVCPFTWTRDLNQGSTGADVMKLQQFLNSDADTRVAAAGAGSIGAETEYYGPATAAAVSKFQVKYRSEILSPVNLVNPTGYFGPSSRSKANALCVTTPVVPPTTDGDDDEDGTEDDDEDEDEEEFELGGEASLDSFDLEDGESSIEEGDEDVEVATMEFEFTDGDAEISRIDVAIASSSVDEWDVFETISLWVDGEKVAEVDASDEDEYLDEDEGEVRFSNLDIIAEEDETVEIVVAVSVQNNVDDEDLGDFDLQINSMRFFDADGVATTDTDFQDIGGDSASEIVTFEVEEAGTDEELNISLASNNPDSTDIVVDTNSDTNDVTILVADLEAEDNDIELNTVIVKVDTTGASTTDVVEDIRVVIDGEEFDAENLVTTNKGTISQSQSRYADNDATDDSVWYVFDIDGDVTLDEDEEVEMEVVVDLKDTDDGNRYANGTQISASITSTETDAWDAEGADDLGDSQFSGSAPGEDHTLVAEGIVIPVDSVETTESTSGDNDQTGTFEIEFEVTAVEANFYIAETATLGTAATTGVEFTVEGPSGFSATSSGVISSTADEDSTGVFTVREGETETFTLTVTIDTDTTGLHRVTLGNVNYDDDSTGVASTEAYVPTPTQDFRTAYKNINAN